MKTLLWLIAILALTLTGRLISGLSGLTGLSGIMGGSDSSSDTWNSDGNNWEAAAYTWN